MGCSASTSTIDLSKRLTLDVIKVTTKKNLPKRFIENCLVIWFDDDEETSEFYSSEKSFLSSIIYQFRTFDQRDECLTFLRDIFDERIFFIYSNRNRSIDEFKSIVQMEKFYRFDRSASIEDENRSNFSQIDRLWQQLEQDMIMCQLDLLSLTTTNNFHREIFLSSIFNVQEASFLFGQAIREIIYRLKFESFSKNVFIDFCRTNYQEHDIQLKQIEEFANNYRPNQALSWLINSTFISRILQRAQRTYEIDIIYKLGFFMKQVHLQLTNLAEENRSSIECFTKVYRGKTMTQIEFDKWFRTVETKLVSFNDFLIASSEKELIIDFLYQRLKIHPERIGILFQIRFNPNSYHGQCPMTFLQENEQTCFDLNTVFHLVSIEQLVETSPMIYIVHLKIAQDEDPQLAPFRTLLRADELYNNPLPFLAKLLMDMGEYRCAEQCFLAFLQDPSILRQPRRLARIQQGLAGTFLHRGDYGKALEYFQKSLQTMLTYLPADHVDLILIYKSIGDCYWNDFQYVSATETYEKAIFIAEKNGSSNNNDLLTDIYIRVNKTRQTLSEMEE